VQSLGSYLTRIRRKESAKPISPTQPASQTTSSKSKGRTPNPNSPDNVRQTTKKKRGFEYPPGPPDESKLI
jgi:hypothetical protein